MSNHHGIAGGHFSKKTLKALSKKGITIIRATYVPGADGSYANGESAYMLDNNGTGMLRSFLEVEAIAK